MQGKLPNSESQSIGIRRRRGPHDHVSSAYSADRVLTGFIRNCQSLRNRQTKARHLSGGLFVFGREIKRLMADTIPQLRARGAITFCAMVNAAVGPTFFRSVTTQKHLRSCDKES